MESSKKHNSLTEFKLYFSEHRQEKLIIVSLGNLGEYKGNER